MRKLTLVVLSALIMAGNSFAGWFDNKDQQHLQQVEQQLDQQRQSTNTWQLFAGILGVSAVGLFVAGTALGSTIRRYGRKE